MAGNRDVSWQPGGLTGAVIKGLGGSRRETPWRPDAFAVIVGIDIYNDPQIPNLRFARKDAEAIYQVLTDPAVGRFNPDNVIMLLETRDGTENPFRRSVTKLPRRSSRGSTVCIYYAGHGAPVIDTDARRNSADNIEKYPCPTTPRPRTFDPPPSRWIRSSNILVARRQAGDLFLRHLLQRRRGWPHLRT